MEIKRVCAAYFSPHKNTKRATESLALRLSEALHAPLALFDFTLPGAREKTLSFDREDLLVLGLPTYAGRIPNKILPYIQTSLAGDGTPALALATFGNRSYDFILTEMIKEMTEDGFLVFGAVAFARPHSIADIGLTHPDDEDFAIMDRFAAQSAALITEDRLPPRSLQIGISNTIGPYYRPLKLDGEPAEFLKATPFTDMAKCNRCGACIRNCPMGSINPEDPGKMIGICIKCQACIQVCTRGAKAFEDPDYLSHKAFLEAHYQAPAHSECFFAEAKTP